MTTSLRKQAAIFCSAAASADTPSLLPIFGAIMDSEDIDLDAVTLASKAFQFAHTSQQWSLVKGRTDRAFYSDVWSLAESLLLTGWTPS